MPFSHSITSNGAKLESQDSMENSTWGWGQREGQLSRRGKGKNEQVEGAGKEGGEARIMLSGYFEGQKKRDGTR